MKRLRELFRKEPAVTEELIISKISICYRCGQVFANEDEAPNHLCVGRDVSATYSFDANTTSTCTHQYRDFTITHEDEK